MFCARARQLSSALRARHDITRTSHAASHALLHAEERTRFVDAGDLAPVPLAQLHRARHQRRRAFGEHVLVDVDVVLEPDARVAALHRRQLDHRQLMAPDAGDAPGAAFGQHRGDALDQELEVGLGRAQRAFDAEHELQMQRRFDEPLLQ